MKAEKKVHQFLVSLFQPISPRLANWSAYLLLAARRLRYNLGLSASALAGMVAVLSLVVCIPAFSHSISSEVLRMELLEKTRISGRSLFSLHIYYLDKSNRTPFTLLKARKLENFILENAPLHLGLPVHSMTVEAQTDRFAWRALAENGALSDEPYFEGGFLWIDHLTQHARITEGAWPLPAKNAGEPIQVAVLEEVANTRFINVGDRFQSGPFEVVVSGLWEAVNRHDPFFYDSPGSVYSNLLWVPEETFTQRLEPALDRPIFFTSWYVVFDDDRVQYQQASRYTRGLNRLDSDLRFLIPGFKTDYTPLDQLNAYLQRAELLATLFYVISAPAAILLFLFIGLVASIVVSQKDREISMMRGRGSTRVQVVGLAFAEVAILLLLALPISLLFGWLEAGLIARTLSFLKFSPGAHVLIHLQGLNIYWLVGVSLVIVVAWLLPAHKMAQNSIIRVKQERGRGLNKPLWERYYLDFFLTPSWNLHLPDAQRCGGVSQPTGRCSDRRRCTLPRSVDVRRAGLIRNCAVHAFSARAAASYKAVYQRSRPVAVCLGLSCLETDRAPTARSHWGLVVDHDFAQPGNLFRLNGQNTRSMDVRLPLLSVWGRPGYPRIRIRRQRLQPG